MIDYLYSSKSIGVRNYTHELYQHMSDLGVYINMCGAGGQHVLSHMNEQQLREHLIERLSGSDSTVLHVQHDTLLFRGGGDMMDEMDNMCWFLEQMLDRYKQVFITFHGRVEFDHVSWIKQPITKLLNGMLMRKWYNQVISTLNRCTVLVHSMPHVELLRSQGCNTVQLFTHPTSRHTVNKPLDVENVRVVIPGRLVDRKRVGLAIETCTHIPNSVLTIDSTNIAKAEHYKTLAKTKQVDVEFVKWSMNTTEYLDQLSEHDVALVMYDEDVSLSGSVIDALRCGLIVGTTATQSFNWFAEQHQCIITRGDLHRLGEQITSTLNNKTLLTQSAWHADNYFVTSHHSALQLLAAYNGQPAIDTTSGTGAPLASPVIATSKQLRAMPNHMMNTSECTEVRSYQGLIHAQHNYKHNPEQFNMNWTGLLHGPFTGDQTTLDKISVEQMISQRVFDNCAKLHVTNTKLKELVESHVNCEVELLKLQSFLPVVQFDVDRLLSTDSRCIVHVGWWCKTMSSFNRLNVDKQWIKLMHMKPDEPTAELMDMCGGLSASARWCTTIPDTCVYFVDQTTDDVVDEQMLHCIRYNIPVLIRRNATTQEYLGDDYPLLFDDIKQAGELLTDENIVEAAQHLVRL